MLRSLVITMSAEVFDCKADSVCGSEHTCSQNVAAVLSHYPPSLSCKIAAHWLSNKQTIQPGCTAAPRPRQLAGRLAHSARRQPLRCRHWSAQNTPDSLSTLDTYSTTVDDTLCACQSAARTQQMAAAAWLEGGTRRCATLNERRCALLSWRACASAPTRTCCCCCSTSSAPTQLCCRCRL